MDDETFNFQYLLEKLRAAEILEEPFRHIYIENFFSEVHFEAIVSASELLAPKASSDEELFDGLVQKGFKPIEFPGCVSDIKKYASWRKNRYVLDHNPACEGVGMALRLYEIRSAVLKELNSFIASKEFNEAIAKKLGVIFEDCVIDGGIQKYLDGYEISPHPDVRSKAATYMVNINSSPASESLEFHTHYLKFKPEREYVQRFWQGNPDIDRAWVPWDWADTVKLQTVNNSIVLFSPANDTLHAVKADYDHFLTQRTQLYGNLWFKNVSVGDSREWEQLDILGGVRKRPMTAKSWLKAALPRSAVGFIKGILPQHNSDVGGRNTR